MEYPIIFNEQNFYEKKSSSTSTNTRDCSLEQCMTKQGHRKTTNLMQRRATIIPQVAPHTAHYIFKSSVHELKMVQKQCICRISVFCIQCPLCDIQFKKGQVTQNFEYCFQCLNVMHDKVLADNIFFLYIYFFRQELQID